MKDYLQFKINTPGLLKEIADCGLDRKMGVLKIPINELRKGLIQVAQRAAELNDPKLNAIMCKLALYDVADPESKDYNPELVNKLINDHLT